MHRLAQFTRIQGLAQGLHQPVIAADQGHRSPDIVRGCFHCERIDFRPVCAHGLFHVEGLTALDQVVGKFRHLGVGSVGEDEVRRLRFQKRLMVGVTGAFQSRTHPLQGFGIRVMDRDDLSSGFLQRRNVVQVNVPVGCPENGDSHGSTPHCVRRGKMYQSPGPVGSSGLSGASFGAEPALCCPRPSNARPRSASISAWS